MGENVDIAGLDKAEVLQCLFNASKQQGMGFMNPTGREPMRIETAREVIECTPGKLSFDYLFGRVLKVDITGDDFAPWLFDRDNGDGAAARAIAYLKESKQNG